MLGDLGNKGPVAKPALKKVIVVDMFYKWTAGNLPTRHPASMLNKSVGQN